MRLRRTASTLLLIQLTFSAQATNEPFLHPHHETHIARSESRPMSLRFRKDQWYYICSMNPAFSSPPLVVPLRAPNYLSQLVMLPPPILSYTKYPDNGSICPCTSLASIDSPEFSVVYLTLPARVLSNSRRPPLYNPGDLDRFQFLCEPDRIGFRQLSVE